MSLKRLFFGIFLLTTFLNHGCPQQDISTAITGDYLGEVPPGRNAKIFAPALVSTIFNEDGSPIFTPDGNEIFWRISGSPFSTFVSMKRNNGVWSRPEIASFSGQYQDAALSISPDGKKIYFASKRPKTGTEGLSKFNTWMTEKINDEWQAPLPVGEPIDHPDDYYTRVSVAADGTLIKQSKEPDGKGGWDLFVCRMIDGKYTEQQNLSGPVNTEYNEYAPQISSDGTFIVFQSDDYPDSNGGIDLFVTFKMSDNTWSNGINLGNAVNTNFVEKWPTITPDGKYLFFTSDRPAEVKYAQYSIQKKNLEEIETLYEFFHSQKYQPTWGDIYWVEAQVIEDLKPHELK